VTVALLVAHPGHELRVHEWVARTRPVAYVLTDGSGSRGEGRIESTRRLLAGLGARPGPVFGRLADERLYRALLLAEHGLFLELAEEIAEQSVREGVTTLVADAAEGFNPGHDVARLLANTVARRARRRGHPLESLAFPLEGHPDAGSGEIAVRLWLDESAFARKLAAARAYREMAGEVEEAFRAHGREAFRVETLRRADLSGDLAAVHGETPDYETWGERRVAEGAYREVVRFRTHVHPLALRLAAEGPGT
jgi:hypothetical protein